MADQDQGAFPTGQKALQPQGGFQVQVVGGLVQQQQIGSREQGGGQGHAHAPAAGERFAGKRLGHIVESQPRQDGCGPGWSGMGVDVVQALVHGGDAPRLGGLIRFGEQRGPLLVRVEHRLHKASGTARGLLGNPADSYPPSQADRTGVGRDVTGDQIQQRAFAAAVGADQPDPAAAGDAEAGVFQQGASLDPDRQCLDVEHGAGDITLG